MDWILETETNHRGDVTFKNEDAIVIAHNFKGDVKTGAHCAMVLLIVPCRRTNALLSASLSATNVMLHTFYKHQFEMKSDHYCLFSGGDFYCKSDRKCIEADLMCNGVPHCSGCEDEIPENCIRNPCSQDHGSTSLFSLTISLELKDMFYIVL